MQRVSCDVTTKPNSANTLSSGADSTLSSISDNICPTTVGYTMCEHAFISIRPPQVSGRAAKITSPTLTATIWTNKSVALTFATARSRMRIRSAITPHNCSPPKHSASSTSMCGNMRKRWSRPSLWWPRRTIAFWGNGAMLRRDVNRVLDAVMLMRMGMGMAKVSEGSKIQYIWLKWQGFLRGWLPHGGTAQMACTLMIYHKTIFPRVPICKIKDNQITESCRSIQCRHVVFAAIVSLSSIPSRSFATSNSGAIHASLSTHQGRKSAQIRGYVL